MKTFSRKTLFLIIFVIIGLIALNISLFKIVGSSQAFSLFDLMGPNAGLFLGPLWGAISVLGVKLVNVVIHPQSLDWLTVLRFLPMMAAAFCLGSKTKKIAFVPLICMVLFIIHPIGRQAWYYAMYWWIPIIAIFKKDRLIFNALGATFTAHAIGSVIFLYAFNLPAPVWIALIPNVALERGIFASGIWVSYLVFNQLLNFLSIRLRLPHLEQLIKPQYLFSKKFLRYFA